MRKCPAYFDAAKLIYSDYKTDTLLHRKPTQTRTTHSEITVTAQYGQITGGRREAQRRAAPFQWGEKYRF